MSDALWELLAAHHARLAQERSELGLSALALPLEVVPEAMRMGPVDDGWVAWALTPSTVTQAEVAELEAAFSVAFPPSYQAYLTTAFHLFGGRSRRFDQPVIFPPLTTDAPLQAVKSLLIGYGPLAAAGLIPFGEFSLQRGPLCFDAHARGPDLECAVVWIEHDRLLELGEERAAERCSIGEHCQPLFDSFGELLKDVFGVSPA